MYDYMHVCIYVCMMYVCMYVGDCGRRAAGLGGGYTSLGGSRQGAFQY